jgi:hypothetical protein
MRTVVRSLAATALLFAGFLVAGGVPSTAHATTVRWLNHGELARAADVVVVGRVAEGAAAWRGTRIVTTHRVRVEATWRGKAAAEIHVVTLGGVVGELGQHVAGEARLTEGERAVLYLVRDAAGDYHPVGLWQGVFHFEPLSSPPRLFRGERGATVVGAAEVFPTDPVALQQELAQLPAPPATTVPGAQP